MRLKDPPLRDTCAECGKPLIRTRQQRKYAGAQIDADPFCTSTCCRKWWGCPIGEETSQKRLEGARASADAYRASMRGWLNAP